MPARKTGIEPVARWSQTDRDRDDEDKILALANLTIIRASGDSFGTEVAYLHTMDGDKVAELRTWLDHEEGLRQLAAPEEVAIPS